ncbi:MAG: hypothetical protein AAGC55_29935, partial [Myxococcota bacterium]
MELFLSPGDEGGQTLDRGVDERAVSLSDGASERAESFPDPGGDHNSLADQGWAVVVPRGEDGERLLELTRPLLDRRAEERGRPVTIYRVKPEMDGPATVAWRDRVFSSNQQQEDIPWYVLVLGQPDQVSLAFQQKMSGSSLVGRLAFDQDEHYQTYVAKVLDWESRPPAQELARSLFFTAEDGTAATSLGRDRLMRPTVADIRQRRDSGGFAASEVVAIEGQGEDGGDALLAAAGAGSPSILMSCSHGMGAPRAGWSSSDRQRALQGSLVLGGGRQLAGADLLEHPFLPGGLWLFFACFSAATPADSAYRHWLSRLKQHGEFGDSIGSVLAALPGTDDPPFIAALPKAVLA